MLVTPFLVGLVCGFFAGWFLVNALSDDTPELGDPDDVWVGTDPKTGVITLFKGQPEPATTVLFAARKVHWKDAT